MGQVHTGAYVSLLAPGKTDHNTACHPRKTTTYILHVVPITKRTHDRHKSIGEKEAKKRKILYRKKQTRQESEKLKRKEKTRQEEQEKTRHEVEATRKGKEKECYTSRP